MNKFKKIENDENFIEEAKIAAILHDTGALEGKENHSLRSYNFAKEYIETNNIVLENEDLVLEAIINFSKKMNLNPRVLFNNYEWKLFDDMLQKI